MLNQEYTELFFRLWLILSKGLLIPLTIPLIISLMVVWFRKSAFNNKHIDFVVLAVFSLFGGLVGLFTGASREPVVGTVLPVIISTVVTYIGYLASKELDTIQKQLLPFCIVVFLIATWVGTLYGLNLRLDWSS